MRAARKEKSYEPQACWTRSRRAFIVHYFVEGGRRDKWVPVGVASEESHREAALAWFGAWLGELQRTGVIPATSSVPLPAKSFRNLLPQWVAWKLSLPGAEPAAIKRMEKAVQTYVLQHKLGDVDLEKVRGLTTLAVDWIEWVQRRPSKVRPGEVLASYSVRNIVQTVRTVLSDVRGKGWCEVPENPFNDSFVKKKTGGAAPLAGDDIIHLSAPQAVQLLECGRPGITPYRRASNCLAVTSGLRAAEVQGLAWSHLHLAAEVPYVDVKRQLKKPGPIGVALFKPPKRRSYRQVPLHPVAVQVLAWWKRQWVAWVGREPMPDDPVFPSVDGDFTGHSGSRWLRQDLVTAGVPATFEGTDHNITVHALRRTFLTLLSTNEVSDDVVARLAGHAKKTVTAKHYVVKDLPLLFQAVMKLPLPASVGWAK